MQRWQFTGRSPQPRRSLARISWNCGQPLPEPISSLCYHLLRTRSDPPKVGVRKEEVHIVTMHVELRCGSCKKGKLEVQLSSASTSGTQDFLIHRLVPTRRYQPGSARDKGAGKGGLHHYLSEPKIFGSRVMRSILAGHKGAGTAAVRGQRGCTKG